MGQTQIVVDLTRAAPGIITSRRAAEMLRFIERCGGVPEEALAVVFRKSRQLLRKLRGAGMIYRVKTGENVLWLPREIHPPGSLEVVMQKMATGWIAVRLLEASCSYEEGMAFFPNGAAFRVAVVPPAPPFPCLAVYLNSKRMQLSKGSIWVVLDELKKMSLKDCLKSGV